MSSRSIKRPLAQAFTLIELLVVVAIIALLISILLPSLHRAKRQARQLVCTTSLRTQGQAANFYAEDNQRYLPRGLQDIRNVRKADEYHIYATAILQYLGWDGVVGLELGGGDNIDVTGDTLRLWGRNSQIRGNMRARAINRILRRVAQFQCPDYPVYVELDRDQAGSNPVDYVANAMPIPYTWDNIGFDSGSLEWAPEGETEGVPMNMPVTYVGMWKLERMPPEGNPAGLVYVTEGHTSLPWKGDGPRLHHFFLAQQLPFAYFPRIANDQRHLGGINALFFDGHVDTMDLHQLDPAYPNPYDHRLKWFTIMPDDYQP